MCAGITTYTPLKERAWCRPGCIKLAKEMGCKVTAISRSKAKENIAGEAGASACVATSESADLAGAANSLDIILDAVPSDHDLTPYKKMLKDSQSRLIILGLCPQLTGAFLAGCPRTKISSDLFLRGWYHKRGGVDHIDKAGPKILPQLKIMPAHKLNNIFEILERSNDEALRYVLDLSKLNGDTASKCTTPRPK